MRNYPLNPFVAKYNNWTKTYLQELNSKIWALKNYSDFFLTDYIQTNIDYIFNTQLNFFIINPVVLDFHNYAMIDRDCYLETDSADSNAISKTIIVNDQEEVHYYRYIPQGSYIISNARAEGSIDANGIQNYDFFLEDAETTLYEPWGMEQDNENTVGIVLSQYGPANPERTNWKNFLVQPSGFASFYTIESMANSMRFVYREKGGENFGTDLDLLMMFQNGRYVYIGNMDQIRINSTDRYSISITAKDSSGQVVIAIPATHANVDCVTPWISPGNPPMSLIYMDRDRSNDLYGEEVIMDSQIIQSTTKLETINTLEYNIVSTEENAPGGLTIFEADII